MLTLRILKSFSSQPQKQKRSGVAIYNLWPIFCLQKRVMRIIYGAKAQDQTNNMFINLNVMKFFDYIEYKTVIKVKYIFRPKNILRLFHSRDECCHVTRQKNKFK